jgi:L-asparaginase
MRLFLSTLGAFFVQKSGSSKKLPVLLIHGGAGPIGVDAALWKRMPGQLESVAKDIWPKLLAGMPALNAVAEINAVIELLPDFNAGKGAYLQNDGQARMSASMMDGKREQFSGVHLVSHMLQPSRLARALQDRRHTVFGPLGAQLLARELGIEPGDPVTLDQVDRWRRHLENSQPQPEKGGTVGAVALDTSGNLAAATSTGGDVSNPPERMSDSATVAGNYASAFAAISCTGIGEQIVNDALAARLETRVRDGRTIHEASELMQKEGELRKRSYAWIAVDAKGNWAVYNLFEAMAAVVMTAEQRAPISVFDPVVASE